MFCDLFVETLDFKKQNYTFEIQERTKTQELLKVIAIDDNIVEINEVYNLTIMIFSPAIGRVHPGENQTTTITIYDNDSKQLCNITIILCLVYSDRYVYISSTYQAQLKWYMFDLA